MKRYRIWNKKTNQYMVLGYAHKTSWGTFPSEAIKHSKHVLGKPEDFDKTYEVHLFELQHTKILNVKKQIIKNATKKVTS